MKRIAGVGLVAMLALAACSHGSSGPSTVLTTQPSGPTTSTEPVVGTGQGALVLGGEIERFRVTSCTSGAGTSTVPQATQLFRLTGSGTVGKLAFTVVASRYSSTTGVGGTTYTETVTVSTGSGDDAKGIEAKRDQVQGKWIDLNDPTASTPLLRRTGPLVEVRAKFGPEGSQAGESDITDGVLVARCPH